MDTILCCFDDVLKMGCHQLVAEGMRATAAAPSRRPTFLPLALPPAILEAKALYYSLKRWVALTRFMDDGQLPIDNNCRISGRR